MSANSLNARVAYVSALSHLLCHANWVMFGRGLSRTVDEFVTGTVLVSVVIAVADETGAIQRGVVATTRGEPFGITVVGSVEIKRFAFGGNAGAGG